MNHPWHDVALDEPIDGRFPVVVETPADSRVQYGIEASTGLLRAKRVLSSAVHYPANYGMIPRTLAPDGEAIDAIVIGQEPIAPVSIVRARAVAILRYERDGVRDDKVIAVHADDPAFREYRRFDQLPAHWRAMLTRFFEDYRALEGKSSHVLGFDGPDAAVSQIRSGHAAYDAVRPFEARDEQRSVR